MSQSKGKIESTSDAWESGKLGCDEAHVKVASPEANLALDAATGLKPISIRLPESLIEELKVIADHNDIGYQPLIRKVLQRFTRSELRVMAIKYYEQMQAEESEEGASPEGPLMNTG